MDHSDDEWAMWKTYARQSLPLVILYPLFSQLVKRHSPHWIMHFSGTYSVMTTAYLLGVQPVISVFIQTTFIFLAYIMFNNSLIVWIAALGYSQALARPPFNQMFGNMFTYDDNYRFKFIMTGIMTAWVNIRCVSFCMDRITGRVTREESLLTSFIGLIAYCFYLPLGIMGPLITSKQFKEGLEKSSPFNLSSVRLILIQSLRYLIWIVVTDILLCAFFHQAFSHQPQLVKSIDMWSLCGMSYLLGQYFHIKYVVMYGCSSLVSVVDDVDAPPHPKCIARIHLYSDMWRHFDVGLYHILHLYIFQPLVGEKTGFMVKTGSSLVIFGFVYVWHGTYDFVLIWSVLNCLGVICESIGREIGRIPVFANWQKEKLGLRGQRRFHALVASPLYLMSCLSNFYFFTDKQVGNIIAERAFTDTLPLGLPLLLFVLYCGSQFSIEVKNYELRRELTKLKQD